MIYNKRPFVISWLVEQDAFKVFFIVYYIFFVYIYLLIVKLIRIQSSCFDNVRDYNNIKCYITQYPDAQRQDRRGRL